MFEYKGFTVTISAVAVTKNQFEYVWSASRQNSYKSGKAGTYDEASTQAKTAIDSSGVQPLYG